MTAVFEQHGLKIQYPENWKLEQRIAENQALEIQIVAPSGAFWSLLAFDADTDEGALMQEILRSVDEQYESAESIPVVEQLEKFNAAGFNVHFFCLDLLIAQRMRCVQSGDHKLLLMYQAENREFDQLEPVFQAITISMLSHLEDTSSLVYDDWQP